MRQDGNWLNEIIIIKNNGSFRFDPQDVPSPTPTLTQVSILFL